MNDLKVIENDLVPVYETSTGEKVIYGSELHEVLEVKSRYREWIDRRLLDIDAVENEDFQAAEISAPSGQTKKEYIIKLDTAKEMAMLSDIIIPKYYKIFNDKSIRHIILTSGRAGTKSSFAAVRADYQIVSDANGSVVVLRKHHNKLRKTVYKEMLRGIGRLKIKKTAFNITKSPMEIKYKKTGATIYFSGSDGIDDTKGIIDEDKPIKLVILDELTEFFEDGEGEDELQNIEATFIRGNAAGFQMIYLYNPPKNPNAPIVEWCKKMEKRPDCVHIHTDYRDVPQEWLGKDLVESAEMMKRLDEKQYNWVWLGLSTGVDELIYYMFSDKHKERPSQKHYQLIGIGVDYGQQNATTYQCFGLDIYNRKIEGLAEYYYSGRDEGKQKAPSEYALDFIQMTDSLYEEYTCNVFYVYIDPSRTALLLLKMVQKPA